MRDLFRTPLFLKMYCDLVNQSHSGALPPLGHSRASMYRLFLDRFPEELNHSAEDDTTDPREVELLSQLVECSQAPRPDRISLLVGLAWELSRKTRNEEPQSYSKHELALGLQALRE